MQLRHHSKLLAENEKRQIRLAANVGVGADAGMTRVGVGLAERLQLGLCLSGSALGERLPKLAVDRVKQVHHVDALIEFDLW